MKRVEMEGKERAKDRNTRKRREADTEKRLNPNTSPQEFRCKNDIFPENDDYVREATGTSTTTKKKPPISHLIPLTSPILPASPTHISTHPLYLPHPLTYLSTQPLYLPLPLTPPTHLSTQPLYLPLPLTPPTHLSTQPLYLPLPLTPPTHLSTQPLYLPHPLT
ncbi:hypothetical protein Pcinc_036005 [Petrolisthes cinctipes]|uniref:Uncharacterized protein n=1 Tax=Petrolisthes cinctipes TaxID=88211 RepID=A0AAE1EP17_PETCI|nr:hypothetical protein Pcinc_036005 [Petrolisthes cinctipes]